MNYPQELIDWFNNYFDNCYYVKHDDYPESIFMFYDVNYIRQLKLANLEERIINKTNITGICIFQQDWKNKIFRCDYKTIWIYLRDMYSFNYDEFRKFVWDMLDEYSKMMELTPRTILHKNDSALEDHSKMTLLIPDWNPISSHMLLEDHSKMTIIADIW